MWILEIKNNKKTYYFLTNNRFVFYSPLLPAAFETIKMAMCGFNGCVSNLFV